jgi:hypothetical protein
MQAAGDIVDRTAGWLHTSRLGQLLQRLATPALAAWFAIQSYLRLSQFVANRVPVGLDARIYYEGVAAWLAGHDPWTARVVFFGHTFSYAGSPATTVLMAPARLLSEDAFTAVWLGLTFGAALWTLRRLELPLWWMLFPPTTEALFSGNPQLVILALLLMRGSLPAAIAVALKVYPIIPLIGLRRWRAATAGVVLTMLTFVVAPGLWLQYLESFGAISARLAKESQNGWSAFAFPILFVPAAIALIALARRDLAAAGWLAVPALWPDTEFHYSTFALPLRSRPLAALLAISTMQWPPIAITLYAIARLAQGRRLGPGPRRTTERAGGSPKEC